MNKGQYTGRLTATPELKQTQSGVSVCSFTLAVKRPRRKNITDYINFVAWRSDAEFVCRYFKKGDAMEVSGALTSRKYQDSDGKNRVAFEDECEDVSFALTNGKAEAADQPQDAPQFEEINADDDVPF
jgi:single-strand DNA-binding protein